MTDATEQITDPGFYMEGFEGDVIPPQWFADWVAGGEHPSFVDPALTPENFAWSLASSACLHAEWLVPVVKAGLMYKLKDFMIVLAENGNDHVYNILLKAGLIPNMPFDEFCLKLEAGESLEE